MPKNLDYFFHTVPTPPLVSVSGMTSAESIQTSRLQVNFDDYVKVGDADCDNGLAGKRLNCEYSGPPKSAREDPEILEILQQICPHLVVEVLGRLT